jgi:hypothetical protein
MAYLMVDGCFILVGATSIPERVEEYPDLLMFLEVALLLSLLRFPAQQPWMTAAILPVEHPSLCLSLLTIYMRISLAY